MIILILFAFIAGVVTILSPCILPILPVVLLGSVDGGKKRPLGIVAGFILSFTFFTLFLSLIVRLTGISPDALRILSIITIAIFGISLVLPKFQFYIEKLFTRLAQFSPKHKKSGFWGGIIIGFSLGLIWTPCVGPILASVVALALTGSVSGTALFITLSYAIGTAIPMLAIMQGGRGLLQKVPWLLKNTPRIQKVFGILMIVVAVGLYFNLDRTFQTYVLNTFPQYGSGLTKIEDNSLVQNSLNNIGQAKRFSQDNFGKPMNEVMGENANTAAEIIPGGEWFNTKPLTLKKLHGKVVLIDFWTYTCINCQRTLPYLKSWYEKYADKGLVIIGVHTPEFEFEKNPQNLNKAIADFGLKYPIVQDNNYDTWNAYSNRYWPAKYFIDKNGKVRFTHFGEGGYDESEQMIQQLLKEAGMPVQNISISNPSYTVSTRSLESYLGYGRIEYLVSPEQIVADKPVTFTSPTSLSLNEFAYTGQWTLHEEQAQPSKNAALLYHFDAQQVFLVMRPLHGAATRVRVLLDEKNVDSQTAGEDVQNSIVTVTSDRLYKLIKLPAEGQHILKLEFLDGNVELYAFTFG